MGADGHNVGAVVVHPEARRHGLVQEIIYIVGKRVAFKAYFRCYYRGRRRLVVDCAVCDGCKLYSEPSVKNDVVY